MQNKNQKERWTRPKLIVLVKASKQEGVLMYCKGTIWGPGADYYLKHCYLPSTCAACSSWSSKS